MSLKEDNKAIQKNNQNALRALEQSFIDTKIDEMSSKIDEQKKEIVNELIKFAEEHTVATKYDKEGCAIEWGVKINPLVINNYFFKSIVPINSSEPLYNAEKLALVFEYYCYVLAEVNDKLGNYPSSLTSFCKMAGITLNTLRNYRNSDDLNMRIIAEKIYDQIGDENLTMGQLGIAKERSTLFKLRSQNEVTEAERPTVKININDQMTSEQIEDRLLKYQKFIGKKTIERHESKTD